MRTPENLSRRVRSKKVMEDVLQFIIQRIQEHKDRIHKNHLSSKRLQVSLQGGGDGQDRNKRMDYVCCPECKDHDDRDLSRDVQELVEIGLLLPFRSILGKYAPEAPRQKATKEHVEDCNEDKIHCNIEDMTLDRRDRVQPRVLHYLHGRLEYTSYDCHQHLCPYRL